MNEQIYEEATGWLIKHREDANLSTRERKDFDLWLRASPQNLRAYLEMSAVWEDIPAIDAGANPSADELIARARGDGNVVALSARAAPASHRPRSWASPIALAASLLVAVAAGWFYLRTGVYDTGIGEQRELTLSDGSTVKLNARSRIRVRYSEDERFIELLEGQALFEVAKNAARPFVVQADDTRVRAVGTAFDVRKSLSGTVVTVVEGKVAVQFEGPGAAPSLVAAGERLLVAAEQTAIPLPQPANVSAATAWTRKSLVFDSSPLPEVAEEFNRYNTRRLVVEDPRLASFHVSGVFSSAEPSLLLRFLRAQPELVVEEADGEIRIRGR